MSQNKILDMCSPYDIFASYDNEYFVHFPFLIFIVWHWHETLRKEGQKLQAKHLEDNKISSISKFSPQIVDKFKFPYFFVDISL